MGKMPYFPFYPDAWKGNANLRRCSSSARGDWMDILCILHDSDEYGLVRWPLKELASAAGVPMKSVKELVEKGVLKGSDDECQEYVFTPMHARKKGEPVILIEKSTGPCWYSSRFVRDHYVRKNKGLSTHFSEEKQPPSRSPKGGIGEGFGAGFGERQKKSLPSPDTTPDSSPNAHPSRSPKGGLVNGLPIPIPIPDINNPPPTSLPVENLTPENPGVLGEGDFLGNGSGEEPTPVFATFPSFLDQFEKIDPANWYGCVSLMAAKVTAINQKAGKVKTTAKSYLNGIKENWETNKVSKTEELRRAILEDEGPARRKWEAEEERKMAEWSKKMEKLQDQLEEEKSKEDLYYFENNISQDARDRILLEARERFKRDSNGMVKDNDCSLDKFIFRSYVLVVFGEECANGVI